MLSTKNGDLENYLVGFGGLLSPGLSEETINTTLLSRAGHLLKLALF
jgi:hypothetical protein